MDRDVMLGMLADTIESRPPRRFAIYGTYHSTPEEPILGWGMELPVGGAIYLTAGDGSVHLSDDADQVLALLSVIGDVRLTWLDDAVH